MSFFCSFEQTTLPGIDILGSSTTRGILCCVCAGSVNVTGEQSLGRRVSSPPGSFHRILPFGVSATPKRTILDRHTYTHTRRQTYTRTSATTIIYSVRVYKADAVEAAICYRYTTDKSTISYLYISHCVLSPYTLRP